MEYVKLSSVLHEVCKKTTMNNQYTVLTSSQKGLIEQSLYFNKQVASTNNVGYKIIRKGQYTYRSMSDTGLFFINRLTKLDYGIVSPAYPVFELVSDKIIPEYLDLYFKSELFQFQIKDFSNGSTRLALKFDKLSTLKIFIPTIEKQTKIVNEIKKISRLKEKYDQELESLETIVKSQFIEMFGVYDKTELVNIAEIIMGQSPDSKSYNDICDGVPFFQGKADYGEKYTIVKHWTTNPTKMAKANSVLMSVRAPVGPVNIANVDCCIGRGLCSIDSLKGKTNNEFLYNALKVMESDIALMGAGSTFKAINKNDIYNLMIPNAPLNLQNEFSSFVQQVDKSKYFGGVYYGIC